MVTKRDRWPNRAEEKRVEAKQLADTAAGLLREADELAAAGHTGEARIKMAQVSAMNERIARLMAEARSPLS